MTVLAIIGGITLTLAILAVLAWSLGHIEFGYTAVTLTDEDLEELEAAIDRIVQMQAQREQRRD